MIADTSVRTAVYIIDTSGIVDLLETGIARDKRGRKPASGDLRLLLIGMMLAIHHEGSATVASIHKLLTSRLTPELQIEIGVLRCRNDAVEEIDTKRLYYQAERLTKGLAYGKKSAPKLTVDERERRHETVIAMSNALMDVFDLGWTSTTYALDATGIWSWGRAVKKLGEAPPKESMDEDEDDEAADGQAAVEVASVDQTVDDEEDADSDEGAVDDKGKRKKREGSFDPDAGHGVKTSKSGANETFFGYDESTLVLAPHGDDPRDLEPRVIRRLELTTAGEDIVDVSLRLLRSLPRKPTDVIVDRHYSYKRVDRWWTPLAEAGIRQHNDLRLNEQGFIEFERMRFAAAWAHCPSTPDSLGTIPNPGPTATKEEKDLFKATIEKRQVYALKRRNQPDSTGATRYECPALAGQIACPLRAGTVEVAIEMGLPIIENPPDANSPEGLPKCCCQQTVKVTPPKRILKHTQPFYWGSSQWRAMYSRRTYVEGSYGNRKNPSTENMRRGLFRSTGLVWANLVVSMTAASYNLRMVQNWQQRTGKGDPAHPLLAVHDKSGRYRELTDEELASINAVLLDPVTKAA